MAKDWSTLTEWTEKSIGQSDVRVQVRLRGNYLHVLCEATPCPRESAAVSQFSTALEQTRLSTLLPPDTPPIYKVFLCGRQPGAKRPEWTVKLECNPSGFARSGASALPFSGAEAEAEQTTVLEKLRRVFERRAPGSDGGGLPPDVAPELAATSEPEEPHPPKVATIGYASARSTIAPKSRSENGKQNGLSTPAPPHLKSGLELTPTAVSEQSTAATTAVKPTPGRDSQTFLTVSPEALARRGESHAIASHLSEILESLSVSVKVSVKDLSKTEAANPETQTSAQTLTRRLWVRCESAYSPDPSLLAEPIARRLRELQLENFRDACILLQVRGEPTPDWMLRIDLTPPAQLLKNWARWGSPAAIAELLNRELKPLGVKVRATLKESTLHLFCESLDPDPPNKSRKNRRSSPAKADVMGTIAPILDSIAPQGILAATVYGVDGSDPTEQPQSPAWIDWLNLPAQEHPDLQPPPLILARGGNLEALTFLLNQLLNPDLGCQLATGGVRVLLLRKGKLLHVMTEAPTCPAQSKVAPPLAEFLRAHPIEAVAGVRIYGRRAGQKHPLWRYGVALSHPAVARDEALREFSEEDHQDLADQTEAIIWRPDLAPEELEAGDFSPWARRRNCLEDLSAALQQGLLATGLFVGREAALVPLDPADRPRYARTGLALAWGALGCLLVLQADWALGQFLENNPQLEKPSRGADLLPTPEPTAAPGGVSAIAADSPAAPPSPEDEVFDRSEFLSTPGNNRTQLGACGPDGGACDLAQLAYPSFNAPQLDEQLARYQQFVAAEKRPPDILIVGSSRALRGVDPAVLEKALAENGYPQLRAFNFGVNGATARVVELIVRRILPPEQLPKLVIVADGVRAINSGRGDRTYDTIAASAGYEQIARGTFKIPTEQLKASSDFKQTLLTLREFGQNPSTAIEQIQDWFNGRLVEISASYPQRDRLKQFLLGAVNRQTLLPEPAELPDVPDAEDVSALETPRLGDNGFLPLPVRFDPQTYYEKYSQVSGYYDSDYQSFELGGAQTNALKTLVEYLDSQDVEIVFVNMPLTREYLDPVRTAYEEKFQEHMRQLEAETGLTFVDLAFEWPNAHEYYSDPSHLNQYGAAAVAERLAEKPMIPWPARR